MMEKEITASSSKKDIAPVAPEMLELDLTAGGVGTAESG